MLNVISSGIALLILFAVGALIVLLCMHLCAEFLMLPSWWPRKLFAPKPKFTTCRCALCPAYVDLDAQLHGRGFLCTPCWKLHKTSRTDVDLMERFPQEMDAWGRHLRRVSSQEIGGMGGPGLDMREQRAAAQDLMRESIAASFLAFDAVKAGRYVEQQELAKRALDLKRQAEELVTASEEASRAMEAIIPQMEGEE